MRAVFRLMAMLVALGCLPLATARAESAAPAPALPEIRFAVGSDTPTSMPGNLARNGTTDTVLAHVVESLVALRADMSIAPMLADSWSISPDGTTYTFQLRKGVLFHNGARLTSADVKWSFDYFMNPRARFECRTAFNSRSLKVLAVDTLDPYTVVFKLDHPSALFLTHMADPRCPIAILNPGSVDSQGAWVKPIGTGPYEFTEWKPGQYVLLTPFPKYLPRPEPESGLAGAKHAYANLRFVTIPDAAAQMSALMSGQIDGMAVDQNDLPPPDPRWTVVTGAGADPAVMLMQTRDPLLSDVRIRRAIALAVDLPDVVNALSNGLAQYNPSLMPSANRLYSSAEAVGYTSNLAQVRSLLAQAGYHGQTLTLETNRRYEHMYSLAVYMQALLSKAGINVDLQVVEWGKQVSDFRSGNFQLMSFGYTARIDPAMMYGDVLGNKADNPMVQWEDPAARELLHSISGNVDPSARQQAFQQLHQMMIAEAPLVAMYDSPDLVLLSTRVHGFTSWPLRLARLFNVTKN